MEEVLVNRTETFQQLELLSIRTDWSRRPPEAVVGISVIGDQTPTPKQVGLLEDFVEKKTGQRFSLVLQTSQIKQIVRDSRKSPLAPNEEKCQCINRRSKTICIH